MNIKYVKGGVEINLL